VSIKKKKKKKIVYNCYKDEVTGDKVDFIKKKKGDKVDLLGKRWEIYQ
jgi:hypothetical protein